MNATVLHSLIGWRQRISLACSVVYAALGVAPPCDAHTLVPIRTMLSFHREVCSLLSQPPIVGSSGRRTLPKHIHSGLSV